MSKPFFLGGVGEGASWDKMSKLDGSWWKDFFLKEDLVTFYLGLLWSLGQLQTSFQLRLLVSDADETASETVPVTFTMGSWRSNRSLPHLAWVIARCLLRASCAFGTTAACSPDGRVTPLLTKEELEPQRCAWGRGWLWADSSSRRTGPALGRVLCW